ncbi:MAG: hypothetical protein JWP87_2738 [Labilithrix sp.]|nr:hypothetical protein [Labilithrix sp.]
MKGIQSSTSLSRVTPRSCGSSGLRLGLVAPLAALAFGVSACERGCLSRWLEDKSQSPTSASGERDGAPSFDLGGTDCSDGLARCVEGRVETSIAAHVPHPCTSSREKPGTCECPWQAVGRCEAGCVKDGVEVLATPEVAREQLCASPEPVLRPLLPNEVTAVSICAGEGVACVDGVVRACAMRGQPATPVGGCTHGCAPGIGVEPGDVLTGNGPAAILCRHAHAERR